jgi:steroid 5-alpha reductase family enzyme
MPTKLNKAASFTIVIVAYIVAFAVSAVILLHSGIQNPIVNMAVADGAATVVIFIFSLILKNSSMYDPYWSVYPIFIAFWWMAEFGDAGNTVRNLLATGLVVAWGVRLTYNWARSWPGMVHEDWRYTKLSDDTGPLYWLVSFLGIHLFPTVLVFLGCIPLYFIFQDPSALGFIDALAVVVTAGAITIEAVADNQLRAFRLARTESSPKIMATGLWGWSRHPNYFGEIMFWVGIFLFTLPQFMAGEYWIIAGMASMIVLFVFISIPMMEKREMRKEGYDLYKKRVSFLVPLPPKKGK